MAVYAIPSLGKGNKTSNDMVELFRNG